MMEPELELAAPLAPERRWYARLAGDLDLAGAARVAEELARVPPEVPLALDLRAVRFCDLAGLRLLEDQLLRAGPLELLALPPAVERLVKLFGSAGLKTLAQTTGPPSVRCARCGAEPQSAPGRRLTARLGCLVCGEPAG